MQIINNKISALSTADVPPSEMIERKKMFSGEPNWLQHN
jgi:hypothetical protein